MFDKWLKVPAHYYLRITALVILTVGICLHNTLMSIGSIWIMANWLIEADFINYWKRFKRSPTVWMLLGILFFGLLSLLWSDDVGYGLKDLGRKMPFFAIPFALGLGKPVEKKIVYFLLYIFVGMLLLTSGINYYRFHYVLEDARDVREMSYFISHVRFSVITVLGVFAALYLIFKKKGPTWLWCIAIAWLCYYTYLSETLTGYVLMVVLTAYTLIYLIRKIQPRKWKMIAAAALGLSVLMMGWLVTGAFLSYTSPPPIDFDKLDKFSPGGREYANYEEITERENGNLIWVYVQQDEVKQEWNKRSSIPYMGKDKNGQPMFGTIFRYMTSKNIRKDSSGLWSLTDEEIRKIENGCTSIAHNRGFTAKFHEFLYQWELYLADSDPNGHSLLQRAEHLKIAWAIVQQEGLFGVGMGDVPAAFEAEYEASHSKLLTENRHRSHNQYLTIWISHGFVGLLMLLGMLFIPLFQRNEIDYFHMIVFLTLFVSLLFQDMLETQAGVTIFGLFYGITVYKEDLLEHR